MISNEAIEAAHKAWREQAKQDGSIFEYNLRAAIEAAAEAAYAQRPATYYLDDSLVSWEQLDESGTGRLRKMRQIGEAWAALEAAAPHMSDTKSMDNSTGAVQAVVDAWLVQGPIPLYHEAKKDQLRHEWPTLANALDALAAGSK